MPTYNSEEYLVRCLESFKAQTFDDWELVCVDRGSSDNTLEILERYSKSWDKLRILEGGDERTSQINIAVSYSESEFIYYTASDFVVDPTLLEDAVRECRSLNADAVWIDCVSYGTGYWARVRNLERSTYVGSVKFEGARFFRRESYLAAGGYDDRVPIFEEYDLQERLLGRGGKIARVTSSREYHLGEPKTLGEIARKSFYYGTQYLQLLDKHGPGALRYANPVRSTFLRHWREFAKSPILTIGFILMVAVKYVAGGAGAASAAVRRLKRA